MSDKSKQEALRAEAERLASLPDQAIDLTDIPETDFSAAEIGKFYRPRKQQLTLRVDADVLAWFRRNGRGYQTRMNAVLRRYMLGGHKSE